MIRTEVHDEKHYPLGVAEEIADVLQSAIDEFGEASIVMSGGRTPSRVYRRLSRPPFDKDIDWANVKVFWGDERWVSHDDDQSNFKMTQETLLKAVPLNPDNIFAVNTTYANAAEGAKEYQERIVKALGEEFQFSLVLLGLGTDGHTASIFPASPVLKMLDDKEFASAVVHPDDGTERITLHPNVLFSANQVFFLVTGEGKAGMVDEVLHGEKTVKEIPAKLCHQATVPITWFLDSAASASVANGSVRKGSVRKG